MIALISLIAFNDFDLIDFFVILTD